MVDQTCADRTYGARPLRRAIQKHIEDALAEQLIRGNIEAGDRVGITVSDHDLLLHIYKPEEEGQPVAK